MNATDPGPRPGGARTWKTLDELRAIDKANGGRAVKNTIRPQVGLRITYCHVQPVPHGQEGPCACCGTPRMGTHLVDGIPMHLGCPHDPPDDYPDTPPPWTPHDGSAPTDSARVPAAAPAGGPGGQDNPRDHDTRQDPARTEDPAAQPQDTSGSARPGADSTTRAEGAAAEPPGGGQAAPDSTQARNAAGAPQDSARGTAAEPREPAGQDRPGSTARRLEDGHVLVNGPGGQHHAAALDTRGLWLPGAAEPLDVPLPRDAGAAYQLAVRYRIRQLWIHPSAHAALGLPETHGSAPQKPEPCDWTSTGGYDLDPAGAASWINIAALPGRGGQDDGGPRRRAVVLPRFENRAAWTAAPDGRALADAVAAFAAAMPDRCAYYFSPNETGKAVLARHARDGLPPVAWPPPALAGGITVGIADWSRHLLETEEDDQWLHSLDENYAQIACFTVKLPVPAPGETVAVPVHHQNPVWDPKTSKNLSGYWLASLDENWVPDLRLPDLRRPWQRSGGRPAWIPTPLLELLLNDLHAPVTLHEAWIWPHSSARLETTGKDFRNARAALLEQAQESCGQCKRCGACTALDAVKATANSFIGWLGRKPDGPGEGEPRIILTHDEATGTARADRDDWLPYANHAIRAKAFANTYRRLLKAGIASGRWPAGLHVDAAWYTSPSPDIETALPPPLEYGTRGGQYKHEHRLPLGPVRDALATPRFNAAVQEWLKQHPAG